VRAFAPTAGLVLFTAALALGQQQELPAAQPKRFAPPPGASLDVHRPHAGMLRYPDVSATHIAFVYANDIWLVPREGGMAFPLASPPGQEMFPRFSPDGQTIAFVGSYDGNQDLYTAGINGGVPTRVTHHPEAETLCDWTPTGELMFFSNGWAGLERQQQLLTVAAEGGLPRLMPVPYGTNASVSADGVWLAYTPHSHDHRTWKRYRGGMATDIWIFNLQNRESRKITDWEGTDSQPMWHGEMVYYLSDAGPVPRLNIWSYDLRSKKRQQVTSATEYDVKWPAIGPGPAGSGEIVFQHGPQLLALDLATGKTRDVQVTVPGAKPRIRPKQVDAGENIGNWNISPTGLRGVFEARGDIWTLPADKGAVRNLTRSSGVAERDPSWSPDGEWIAYFSDATGEYELVLARSDGRTPTRQLTSDGHRFRFAPTWSPDSKHIFFADMSGARWLHTIDSGQTRQIDQDPWASASRVSWSPDSRWLAFARSQDNARTALSSVWLYDVQTDEKTQVTTGMFNDSWPTFDREGKYLYLASNRNFTTPLYEDLGTTFVYSETDVLMVVPLRKDLPSPFAPESNEEKWGAAKEEEEKEKEKDKKEDGNESPAKSGKPDEKEGGSAAGSAQDSTSAGGEKAANAEDEKADTEEKDEKKPKKIEPVNIDLEGFEHRAVALPVERGSFTFLAVNDKGQLLYVRQPPDSTGRQPAVKAFDLEGWKKDPKKAELTVLENVGVFVMSADGKKIMVSRENQYGVVDPAADQKLEKTMPIKQMTSILDPREEWRQLFVETWRIQRDYFYDPNMHGVDWAALRNHYLPLIEDAASREDVTYIIGELISELNAGHAYARSGGDLERPPQVSVGLLGCDFELADGAYRIARIHEGAAWDIDARGPLSQPGVNVKVGDYLLAVDAAALDARKDPWAAFVDKADRVVTLTVSSQPVLDDQARDVVVRTLPSERTLRYRGWIEHNRRAVEEKSGGRVGYIYVPNTGRDGQNDLFRQFHGQLGREALIIDERWNGGGQIPTRFIELLNRPIANYWAVRNGYDWPWPPDAHQGPKCMLINGLAGSGGDYFPWYFKQRGLGKLIGTRTWGGLVGISGNPQLIDGGNITAPTFAFYETDSTWGVEGHGVDPDIEVIDDPALMAGGADPQLDAAVAHLLAELQRSPFRIPRRPIYPNRRGMGIREEDK
jgi:tricorn protease